MNRLLRGCIFSVALIFIALPVKAADNCVTYKSYYFFDEINNKPYATGKMNDGEWRREHETYFPKLFADENIARKGRVCLSSGDKNDANGTQCIETWTTTDFYNKIKNLFNAPEKPLTTPKGQSSYKILEENNNKYLFHYKWYEIDGGNATEKSNVIDYSSINTTELLKGAFFPSSTVIVPNFDDASSIMMNVKRTITSEDIENVEGFDFEWEDTTGEHTLPTILTPTLYLIEYEVCKYNAVIDYFYAGTEDRIIINDKEYPAHTEKDLDDGYTNEVESPKLKGCTPDMEKVKIEIKGKDFYQPVYYTCDAVDNPKTGSFLIYTAWLIGAGALGYSIYYLIKSRPKKIKD